MIKYKKNLNNLKIRSKVRSFKKKSKMSKI